MWNIPTVHVRANKANSDCLDGGKKNTDEIDGEFLCDDKNCKWSAPERLD